MRASAAVGFPPPSTRPAMEEGVLPLSRGVGFEGPLAMSITPKVDGIFGFA